MKIMKLLSITALVAVAASLLSACIVETRPWRPVHHVFVR